MPPKDWQPHWFVTCLDIWLGTEVWTEHLMEERQLKIVFPEVRVSSRLEHRPEQFVGCVCVCVCYPFDFNSKSLTITRLSAHVWAVSARMSPTHSIRPVQPLDPRPITVCLWNRAGHVKAKTEQSHKTQIRVGQTFALTSDQHINHLSDTHSLICITHLNKRPPDSFFLKQLLFCVLLYEFGG